MTVADLIQRLDELPPSAEVFVADDRNVFVREVTSADWGDVYKNGNHWFTYTEAHSTDGVGGVRRVCLLKSG